MKMKTAFTMGALLCTALAFAAPPATVSPGDTTHHLIDNANQTKTRTFGVSVFPKPGTLVMNMLLENYSAKDITVTLKTNYGKTLCTERIGKRTRSIRLKFNFSQMPDDKYLFVVENGKDRVVKEMNVTTTEPVPVIEQKFVSQRMISMR